MHVASVNADRPATHGPNQASASPPRTEAASAPDQMRPPLRRSPSAPAGPLKLFDFKAAIREALQELLPVEEDPDFPHLARWQWFAPHLAEGMLQPPHDVAHILGYLEHPAFEAQRVALGRGLVREVTAASTDIWPRRLVVQEAILLWLQERYPDESALDADLAQIYDAMGTVEARARAKAASPQLEAPWMRRSLAQMLQRAKRFDDARCMQAHTSFFIGGAIFAALHLGVGAVLGVASAVAFIVGVPSCFGFALTFVGCGVGIAVGWSCFYGMLWAYYRWAPWPSGTRDADLNHPPFMPPETPPEPVLQRPAYQTRRRHSYDA